MKLKGLGRGLDALLPAAERSWSLARVVRCEGARAVIVRREPSRFGIVHER